MEIYRKRTTTDLTVNNKSCHPKEHKLAAYRSWIHRLLKLPSDEAVNNGYNKEDITQLYNKLKHNVNYPNNKKQQRIRMDHIHIYRRIRTKNH
jgi:hypothetical protein